MVPHPPSDPTRQEEGDSRASSTPRLPFVRGSRAVDACQRFLRVGANVSERRCAGCFEALCVHAGVLRGHNLFNGVRVREDSRGNDVMAAFFYTN